MSTQGLLSELAPLTKDGKDISTSAAMIPYHKIVSMKPDGGNTAIVIDDGSRFRKRYVVGRSIADIEIAAAAYVEPAAKFTTFTVTKFNGKVQPAGTTIEIGEHLVLEVTDDTAASELNVIVENGTIYPDVYRVTESIAAFTTRIDTVP